jgi:hypothetical protein
MLERRSWFQVSVKTVGVEFTMTESHLFWDIGRVSGFDKTRAPNAFWRHCLNQRQVLAEGALASGWKQVLCFVC